MKKITFTLSLFFSLFAFANAQISYTKTTVSERMTLAKVIIKYPITVFHENDSPQTINSIIALTKAQEKGQEGVLNTKQSNFFFLRKNNQLVLLIILWENGTWVQEVIDPNSVLNTIVRSGTYVFSKK